LRARGERPSAPPYGPALHAEDGEHICARADLRPLGSSEAPLVGVPKPRPRPPPSRIRGEAAGQEGLACRSRPRPTYGCDTPLAKQLHPLHISGICTMY
jgi:hypothetical protein